MDELKNLVDEFHKTIDKKEFLSYIKSCYKSDNERGYISYTINLLEEKGKTEHNRAYKTMDDLKKINSNSDGIKQIISLVETYDKEWQFVLVIKLLHCGNPLKMVVSGINVWDGCDDYE
jgi:hypothetical protein